MKFVHCLILILITFEFSYGMSSFTKASVKFSLNFFRKVYKLDPSQNCVISPIAIQRSLTMLHHVARGDVSRKMKTLLGLPNNHSLQNGLNNPNALEMVTKVFHSQLELNPDLLPELQAEHSVDVEALEFSHPQRIVHAVNNWTALATNGRVENAFSTQRSADDANLIMMNTITLNAPWETPRSMTMRPFKYIDCVREVPMIRITEDYRFAEIDDLQILEVATSNTDLSMLIIQSKSRSLADVIKKFNLKSYRLIDKRLSDSSLSFYIPEFSISTALEAKRILDALGLSSVFSVDAFEVFANFTSRLANVYQVLSLDIGYDGIQAAAGSRQETTFTKDESSVVSVTRYRYFVDGPFMFLVRENSSKDIIFIGHYSRYDEC